MRARHGRLAPIIRRQKSGGSLFKTSPGKKLARPYFNK
jgi:hypothetical protein